MTHSAGGPGAYPIWLQRQICPNLSFGKLVNNLQLIARIDAEGQMFGEIGSVSHLRGYSSARKPSCRIRLFIKAKSVL